MAVKKIGEHLYQIDLNQNLTGFRNFINAWLYRSKGVTFVVDPGPKASIEVLIETLVDFGVTEIDFVLLTHIHIDHAGGTGRLLEVFPGSKVVCHPKGIPHLIDPEKLWQGSLKILGPIAEAYGEILPVQKNFFLETDLIETPEGTITVIATPGHAVHHQSFLFGKTLFGGEVAGFVSELSEGVYQRPATPPRFKLSVSVESLNKLRAFEIERFCAGHYGSFSNSTQILERAIHQLNLWVDTVREVYRAGQEDLNNRVVKRLFQTDPLFTEFQNLDSDTLERETYFVGNTIKGMLEYIISNES